MAENQDMFGDIQIDSFMEQPKEDGKTEEPKELEKTEDGVTIYDDGSFELAPAALEETDDNPPKEEEDREVPSKKEETKEDKTLSEDDKSKSSPSSQYLAFAKLNAKERVFSNFTDEEWQKLVEETGSEADALFELNLRTIQSEVQQQVSAYKESLSDEDRAIYEAKEQGLPLDKVGTIKRNKEYLENVDVSEDESTQKDIIKRDLKLRGFEDDEIDDTIQSLEDTDKLKSRAENSLKRLKNYYKEEEKSILNAKKQEEEQRKVEYQKSIDSMKKYVNGFEEIIPGIKMTAKDKEEVFKSMLNPVTHDQHGNPLNAVMVTRMKNPEAFELAVHYYHRLGLFNVDEDGNFKPDFSKITTKKKSEVSKEMRDAFEHKEGFKSGSSKSSGDGKVPENLFGSL